MRVLEVHGPITPTVAGYVDRGISDAERAGDAAVVIQLDTPGGLDDSMRRIMQRMIASKVPVVVYVYPSGARAASAGMFITQAAHVAAMAPDTNIGSAHPVQLGGGGAGPLGGGSAPPDDTMTQKIENDAVAIVRSVAQTRGRNPDWAEQAVRQSVNVPAREALELKVVDLVAPDYASLLKALDGRDVAMSDGSHVTLHTADATVQREPMTFSEELIQTISDPNIAYLLLTIGLYGLIYELANPGTWIPGVAGAVAIVLALYALGTLPVNWAGVALIALSFGLFLADVLVTSGHGGLTAAGLLTLLLGSLFLFSGGGPDAPQLSPWVIAGVVIAMGAWFVFVARKVYESRQLQPAVGGEAILGQTALVERELAPNGTVQVAGELWRAEALDGASVPRGGQVTVVDVDGLTLKVRPKEA